MPEGWFQNSGARGASSGDRPTHRGLPHSDLASGQVLGRGGGGTSENKRGENAP